LGVTAFLSLIGFALLKSSDGIAKAVATYFSTVAEAEAKSLDEAKNELSGMLRTLTRPMLVVIDDVDRLAGPELRLVFQLIKANADFPNLVYLVLFQREVVEGILTKELSTDGREYLKKIVQVGFDVPSIQRSRLEAILFSKLNVLLGGKAVQKLWDKERWTEIFIPGLGPYFVTLRDIYRFISSLSLQFAVFSQGDAFEVNPIDLISLEVLRVFEPEVYNALPASKDTLTRVEGFGSTRSHAEATEKNEILAIVQKSSEERRKSVEEILTQVFPPISWVFAGLRYGSDHSDSWYRAHRACHPDVFDKYFQLTIPEGELSHEEVERIVALAGDRQALVNELRATGKRNLLDVAIDRLQSYKETISLDHAMSFISAMFDIGDELPGGRLGLSEIPPDMHAARIVYWYLKREPEIVKRQGILMGCIKQTTGIYLPCFVVALEGDKAKEGREQGERLADDVGVKDLQELCVSKICQAATDGTLTSNPRLGELLSFWLVWSTGEEARNWVGTLIESREGLLSFLAAALREGRSWGHSRFVGRSFWDIDLDRIEKLVALELIERKLAESRAEDLEGKQKQAVEVFQEAMKRKREGKPRTSILDDESNDSRIEPTEK
jgi:predicted KAP-like P-loop ATPase